MAKISEIEQMKKSFFADLELYQNTKKETYKKCALYTLEKIKVKGYGGVYERLKAEI